jgi:hypothetical protein
LEVELIQEQRVSRIKSLIERYYEIRTEVQMIQDEGKKVVQGFLDEPPISTLMAMNVSKSSDWAAFLGNQRSPPPREDVTLSQLESAFCAKWKSSPFS